MCIYIYIYIYIYANMCIYIYIYANIYIYIYIYTYIYIYISYVNVSVSWTIPEHQKLKKSTGLSQLIRLTRPVFHTWIAIFLCTGALVSALFDSSNCANCQQIARSNCREIASKLPANCQ